jgi:signal transduction histidine kinase
MRLTLRKKAFGIFILFEIAMLAIFGVLLYTLNQAEAESLREERAKRIIGETQSFGLLFTKAGDSIVTYGKTHDQNALKPFDEAVGKFPAKVEWLREQFKDSPEQSQTFARVEENSQQMVKLMTKVRKAIPTLDDVDAAALVLEARARVQPKLDVLVKDSMTLIERENQIVNASPERARAQRAMYSQGVKVGFVATTLLAVLGLLAFMKDVLGRLAVMEDNTRLLAKSKELNPPLPGGDEIAHLDHVFHDMAAALKEAQEVRKAFVAMVSHDLRSPLTSVSGYLELLEMGILGELTPQATDGLVKARANVTRLIRLINDLLDLEKMESGTIKLNLSQTSMKKTLDDSVEVISVNAAKANVTIERAYDDAMLMIDGDRVVQVVVNLLSNAIKFAPEGSVVRIAMTTLEDGGAEVRVADKGRGVPEKYKELIFERFRQVDDSDHVQKGGTGLGLPICKAIVEQHGGSIGVDSVEGQGSEFWFRLPRRSDAAPNVVAASGEFVDSVRR